MYSRAFACVCLPARVSVHISRARDFVLVRVCVNREAVPALTLGGIVLQAFVAADVLTQGQER